MKVLQNVNEELQSIPGGFELKLHGLSDQLKLKEHQIEHTLMNLRINPDCLNDRKSWMKNMVQEALDPTNQCKVTLV
jgi:hypothetical protein